MHPSRASAFAPAAAQRGLTRSSSLWRPAFIGLLLIITAATARAAPEITTASLPGATAGAPYSATLGAANGTAPYTWTVADGALPVPLGLDGGTGEISGTSNTAATTGFVILVTDAVGDTASKAFSIQVSPGAPATLTFVVEPSDVVAGVAIVPAVQLKVADTFDNAVPGESVSLSLSGTGVLTGGGAVPTDGSGLATFPSLSVDVQGSKQLVATSGALGPVSSVPFVVSCGTVTVSPTVLPDAQANVAYSQSLGGSGGVAPYSFSLTSGALPAGLALSPGGLVSGTPTATGVFNFQVTATSTGGCSGVTPITLTVPGVPAAVSDLAVIRKTTGNDADGTALMQVTFTPSAFTTTVEVYRAAFGGYPRYDDAGGLVPPTPSYPPGAPWVLTGVTASGQFDDPPQRDAWSYVVFLKNSFGQASTVSNKTPTRPNYALGDVSNGMVAGTGDNAVDDLDISLLGAHYGISGTALTSAGVHYLDVGPTTDFLVTSRPFTDIRLDFEDLIVCATNYGAVSSPSTIVAGADAAARAAKGAERVSVHAPSLVEAGQVFEVALDMEAAGRVQGLSAVLAWDPHVAEPLSSAAGGWVEAQKGVVWSSSPGVVDAALLGARSTGLAGHGTIARLTFRALRLGDPAVRLAKLLARDAANRPLAGGALMPETKAAAPSRTMLFAPWPNPATGPATLTFALAQAGQAELSIYSVDGRRVRLIATGPFEPGSHHFTWDGDDDQRRDVAPGVYYAQLVVQGRRYSRTIVHLR